MKTLKTLSVLFLVLFAVGCGSPLIGTWKADNVKPASPAVPGPGQLMLNVHQDGTFMAVYTGKDGAKRGASGDWDEESNRKIRLFTRSGNGPKVSSAELTNKNTLTLIGEGFAEELKRD